MGQNHQEIGRGSPVMYHPALVYVGAARSGIAECRKKQQQKLLANVGPSQMSQVRSDLSSRSDSLNGDPVPDQTPFLPTSAGHSGDGIHFVHTVLFADSSVQKPCLLGSFCSLLRTELYWRNYAKRLRPHLFVYAGLSRFSWLTRTEAERCPIHRVSAHEAGNPCRVTTAEPNEVRIGLSHSAALAIKLTQRFIRNGPQTGDQEEISSASSAQNPAVAPSALCHIQAPHPQAPATEEKEKLPEDDKSPNLLANGTPPPKGETKSESMVTPKAVTRQPQVRTPLRGLQPSSPMDCTPLLQNGARCVPDLGGANRDAGNGVLGSLPSSQKPHRKLQSHYSINSQGSKKSKGSSKSASSQIPVEAQQVSVNNGIIHFSPLFPTPPPRSLPAYCATCGSCSSEDSCICCCCCGSGECADCDLPCDMDCGIVDACCESADCLEICMECCGLCFSS
ncbi:MyoD family inhibitor [Chelonia mydas]|uniref:MyoD family inhibitor n=1 Tax=Chelonia mydas TaxID=8469 RepID=M7BG90_CHEMY|nr:MyoD family inhibitor [Chelonia mydas]